MTDATEHSVDDFLPGATRARLMAALESEFRGTEQAAFLFLVLADEIDRLRAEMRATR
jgi:hypothetical protein